MVDYETMVSMLLDDAHVNHLTPWEIEFVESCQARITDDCSLSMQQEEKLEEIYRERIGSTR